jgi:hypothetical protein
MRKLIVLLLTLIFMMVSVPAFAADIADVKVTVNGVEVYFPDQKPYIDKNLDRTYVPLRFVTDYLGGTFEWDGANSTAKIKRNGIRIEMPTWSISPVVNGEQKTMDAPAVLVNDRTCVPLRFVSEFMGANVEWIPANWEARITDAKAPKAKDPDVKRMETLFGVELKERENDKGYYEYHECVALKSKDYYRSYLSVAVNTREDYRYIEVGAAWPHNGVVGLGYVHPSKVNIDLSPLEKVVEELIPDYRKKDQILAHAYKVVEKSQQLVEEGQEKEKILKRIFEDVPGYSVVVVGQEAFSYAMIRFVKN